MSLRCTESTHLASFLASMTASIQLIARVFPSWLRLDNNGNFTSESDVCESCTDHKQHDEDSRSKSSTVIGAMNVVVTT